MRIISVSNQKGGVAKTSTAAAIAQGAIKRGKNALCVDLDPQGSLTTICRADGTKKGSYDLLKGADAAPLIQHIPCMPDMIPASLQLAGADAELSSRAGRDFLLQAALKPLKEYDLIVIDTPPTLGTLLVNSLTAAHEVIIPLQADTFALQSIYQLADTIKQVQQYCNPGLTIRGALLTKYSPRTVLARDLRDTIAEKCAELGIPMLTTAIREGVAVKEAQTMRENLFDYAPRSNPAKDYEALLNELEV